MLDTALADRIDALLPQTQCTKCGYQGCRPYAEAMAAGDAEINQCPPGGAAGIVKLAALLGRPVLPLNPANGVEKPLHVAVIDESLCIGCTLCIQACPVDAILGAAKRMHTVLAPLCTGCDLCVAPCPMDCIAMIRVDPPRAWTQADADAARARYDGRQARLAREALEREERLAAKAVAKLDELEARDDLTRAEIDKKKAVVQAAIKRARARRQANP
jgi:electron transport complex protein RnfB